MSKCGNRLVKQWDLDKDGYLIRKLDKNNKQMTIDLFQDIQDHFGEVDFKSKLDQLGTEKENVINNLNDLFKKNNLSKGKVIEDVNNKEFVDIMDTFAKFKNTFGKSWGDALKNYVSFVKDYQAKNMKMTTEQITKKESEVGKKVTEELKR